MAQLTPSQSAAVSYEENLILFAGPGSGKTSTSVAKGKRILQHNDNRLCMVTFTSASAAETNTRMGKSFQVDGQAMPKGRFFCGTFHSLAMRHLQQHDREPKKLIKPAARAAMINAMLGNIAFAERKEFLQSLEKYQGALDQLPFKDSAAFEDHIDFILTYHERLKHSGSIDFAIMMRDCALRMRDGSLPLLPITHLIGDEMQDADEIQLTFVLAHTRNGVITTLVADDDQSIYGWRSALGYAGLQHFAKEAKAKTIALGENFRSRSEIVDHAKRLIAFNDPNRIDKKYKAVRGPGGHVSCRQFANLQEQIKSVVRYAQNSRKDDETMAVLARTNSVLASMAEGFIVAGIPCSRDGQGFWDLPPAAMILSTFRSLVDTSGVFLHPIFSLLLIEPRTLRLFEREIGQNASNFLSGLMPDIAGVPKGDVEQMAELSMCFSNWRNALDCGDVNLVIPQVCDHVYKLMKTQADALRAGSSSNRSESKKLLELFVTAENIFLNAEGRLSERLTKIDAVFKAKDDPMSVKLLTMHSSKGLEFDTVFLIDAVTPDDASLQVHEEAERRLFYVAVTRPKENLKIYYSDTPSPFIYEGEYPIVYD